MSISIEPADATLGAVVTGVRIGALAPDEWRAIEAAFDAYAVLIFPGQHPTRDEQRAFGLRFGALDALVAATGTIALSNVLDDGTLMADGHPGKQLLRGNEGWHTDSSYMPVSAKASMLSAEIVPDAGGETEWADMRAAWDALEPALRARIEPLCAHHSIRYSQARAGLSDRAEKGFAYGLDQAEAPLRPLVKTHPATGRRALFIGRHAHAIPGLDPHESEKLLDDLLAFACQPPRVLAHRWAPGDLAVWDNRCVLHRARPYDARVPRVLHHTRIAGDPATESALPAAGGAHERVCP